MSITGEPDGEPQKVGVALVDVLAGLFATVGILAALRHRDATGEGQRVEVEPALVAARRAGEPGRRRSRPAASVPERMGNQHPSIAPYELMRRADGDLVLAVGNDRQFAALCEAVGRAGAGRRRALRHQPGPGRAPRRAARRAGGAPGRPPGRRVGRGADGRAASRPGEVNDIAAAFGSPSELGLRAGRQPPARGRLVRRPHAQPDRAVRDAAGVPHGAAAPAGARAVRPGGRLTRPAADRHGGEGGGWGVPTRPSPRIVTARGRRRGRRGAAPRRASRPARVRRCARSRGSSAAPSRAARCRAGGSARRR